MSNDAIAYQREVAYRLARTGQWTMERAQAELESEQAWHDSETCSKLGREASRWRQRGIRDYMDSIRGK